MTPGGMDRVAPRLLTTITSTRSLSQVTRASHGLTTFSLVQLRLRDKGNIKLELTGRWGTTKGNTNFATSLEAGSGC